jgi:hypothetical protein
MIKQLEKYTFKKGDQHVRWKGGRFIISNGYVAVYHPGHPYPTRGIGRGNYVLEHRLVMEQKIGRYLTNIEIVHHINGIKTDNRPENLELMTSGSNVAISNRTRPVTDSYRKKRSDNASKFKRNSLGRFEKS